MISESKELSIENIGDKTSFFFDRKPQQINFTSVCFLANSEPLWVGLDIEEGDRRVSRGVLDAQRWKRKTSSLITCLSSGLARFILRPPSKARLRSAYTILFCFGGISLSDSDCALYFTSLAFAIWRLGAPRAIAA